MKKALIVFLLLLISLLTSRFSLLTSVFAVCNPPVDYSSCTDQHPDKNLKVRGWEPIAGKLDLIEFVHPIDPAAPQLSTLIEGAARPAITSLYQVYEWDWVNNQRDGLYPKPADAPDDFATIVGFETGGKAILVPQSGYSLGGEFEVLVLYASPNSITLKYTCEDDVVIGYTIHLEGLDINDSLLAFYNELDQAGRESLPVLEAGARIGQGKGEILVAIRDTGSFMDPRWQSDWWQNQEGALGRDLELGAQRLDACGGGKKGKSFLDTSPSLICGQTTYEASREITPVPTPEEGEGEASVLGFLNLFGEVKLPEAEFPNYSLFEAVARKALAPLLPAYFQDPSNPGSLNIPEGTLPIKIKHRIEGQDPEDKQDPSKTVTNSQTEAAFVPFLAENYALSALFNPKSGSINSLNYVLPEVEAGIPPEGNECAEGGETKDEDLAVDNLNPGFSANILEEIINIIGNIIKKILKTEVKVESRGNVYGGEKLIEKSGAASTFVPEYFLPDEDASSYQEGTYSISTNIFGAEEKTEILKYRGQKSVYDSYCGLLCSVYPAKFKPKDCECK